MGQDVKSSVPIKTKFDVALFQQISDGTKFPGCRCSPPLKASLSQTGVFDSEGAE